MISLETFRQTATLFEVAWTLIAFFGALMCAWATIDYLIDRAVIPYWSHPQDREELELAAISLIWREVVRLAWHFLFFTAGLLAAFSLPNPNIETYGVSFVLSLYFPAGIIVMECVSSVQTIFERRNKQKRRELAKRRMVRDHESKDALGLAGRVGDLTPSVIISQETPIE